AREGSTPPLRWAHATGTRDKKMNATRQARPERAICPPEQERAAGQSGLGMVVQKSGMRLFFASIAQFGRDVLAQHLAAVIENLNQAGAGGAGVGYGGSQFGAGKQPYDLPLVLSGLDPEFVLLPLGHRLSV